jgi:hypothetical protein
MLAPVKASAAAVVLTTMTGGLVRLLWMWAIRCVCLSCLRVVHVKASTAACLHACQVGLLRTGCIAQGTGAACCSCYYISTSPYESVVHASSGLCISCITIGPMSSGPGLDVWIPAVQLHCT